MPLRRIELRVALSAGFFVAVSGCASHSVQEPAKIDGRDPVVIAIDQAARQIQRSWNEIGQIEKTRAPKEAVAGPESFEGGGLPPGLERTVRLNGWAGPIETFVERMAHEADYQFSVVGQRPAGVIVVYLDTGGEQKSIGYLLRDAGYQAGNRAGIVIRAHTRTVELVYPQPARG